MSSPALAEGTFFKKKPPATGTSADAGVSAPDVAPDETAPAPPATAQEPPRNADEASLKIVSGNVDEVPSTDVLIVSGQRVRLAGVRGVSGLQVTNLLRWIEANGNYVTCRLAGRQYRQYRQYRCTTATAKDVGLAVIFMGAGKARQQAPPDYLQAQAQARAAGKGVWSRR